MNKLVSTAKRAKLIPIGNSTGVILPKEVLARLGVQAGDTLSLVEAPDGFELRRSDDGDFQEQLAIAREVMERRKRALRELAK